MLGTDGRAVHKLVKLARSAQNLMANIKSEEIWTIPTHVQIARVNNHYDLVLQQIVHGSDDVLHKVYVQGRVHEVALHLPNARLEYV